MNLTELLVRVAVFYITLLLLARIAGRQEISQMTFFNFISSIAIGSIAANMKAWLKNELKRAGIHSVDEVFFAEVQQDGTLYADKKERMVH